MFSFFKKDINKEELKVPKGWYVAEAGQSPLHMLWFVLLINFDDVSKNIENPRYYTSEENDSFDEALKKCIEQIKD